MTEYGDDDSGEWNSCTHLRKQELLSWNQTPRGKVAIGDERGDEGTGRITKLEPNVVV